MRGHDPDIDFAVLNDSNFRPAFEGLDYTDVPLCTEQGLCDWESHFSWETEEGSIALRNARLDASCLDHHDDAEAWKCSDLGYVIRTHLTEPLFVRTSRRDKLLSDNTIDGGWAVNGEPVDEVSYAAIVRAEARDVARAIDTAQEGPDFERAPGLFVPTCPKHETLSSNGDTFRTAIDLDGRPTTMLELFQAWRRGEGPRVAISESLDDEVCP